MKIIQTYLSGCISNLIRNTFIVLCCFEIACCIFSCNKEIISFSIITKVDMEGMAYRHLNDFSLIRSRPKWDLGKEYVFCRESDTACVFITIGLHQSGKDAENIANKYLTYISAGFNEGPHQGVSIGDKFWWLAPFQDNSVLTNIVFIKENALFIMSSGSYNELKTLAQKIDHDIIIKANYIESENAILLPVIDSITASKKVLKEGETAKITVYANDPNNEPLEYSSGPGLVHSKSDPAYVFTVIASPSYISAPFLGSHIYTFFVVNESNAVSEAAEFEIQITE